jgi:hypothetical protein
LLVILVVPVIQRTKSNCKARLQEEKLNKARSQCRVSDERVGESTLDIPKVRSRGGAVGGEEVKISIVIFYQCGMLLGLYFITNLQKKERLI